MRVTVPLHLFGEICFQKLLGGLYCLQLNEPLPLKTTLNIVLITDLYHSKMGPKVNALDTKARVQELKGFKKLLSREIMEDTWTAGDQAYLEFWRNEKVAQIGKLQAFLDKLLLDNSLLKTTLKEKENTYRDKIKELRNKVNDKCEEIVRLTEGNHRLIEERKSNGNSFAAQKEAEGTNFNEIRDKLSSEINFLNGKLNDLEEFRIQRAALIEKNGKTLANLNKMEERANNIVDVYQRIGAINRVRMAQELKERLLKLSMEFQGALQTETTRNLIRENIAINNELGGHIGSWQALHDENIRLKNRRSFLLKDLKDEETLKEKCVSLNLLQTQVIERLLLEHKKLTPYYNEATILKEMIRNSEKRLAIISNDSQAAVAEERLILQTKHSFMTEVNDLEQKSRVLNNVNFVNGINLKRALLLVAEGQDLRLRKARGRLSNDALREKLEEILRTIEGLFREDKPKETGPSIEIDLKSSVSTVFDPMYGYKYWANLGITYERSSAQTQLEDVKNIEADKRSDDSSDEDSN